VFSGMMLPGLAGEILHPVIDKPETVFFLLADSLFMAVLNEIPVAAVLSAIMSTVDSQLLVSASAIAHQVGFRRGSVALRLWLSRPTIVALASVTVIMASPVVLIENWRAAARPVRARLGSGS
jgi:sodium/proline symporter